MLFWNNDYSRRVAGQMRPVRSAVQPASAERCWLCHRSSYPMDWWSQDCKHSTAPFTENIPVFRGEWIEMSTISHCYISFIRLQSHILPCSFSRTPQCFYVLKSRARTQGSVSHMCADPDVLGIVNTRHCSDSQKYPSSDVNTIDGNIDYWSKCSSMIYGKSNAQSIAMKADRSPAMISINLYITGHGLTQY